MTVDNLSKLFSQPWAIILGIVLILLVWEGGKKWLPKLIEWLASKAAHALAGTRMMNARALRAYREKVADHYAHLPVLFIPEEGIDVSTVYVPLQAVDERHPTEAYDQIKATDRVIVLGGPGSGKSMLLRHSMITWARDQTWRRGHRVPVLLELTRRSGGDKTLEDHIVDQFDEDGFAKAARFVHRALPEGKLSLLFDGLDEVSSAERDTVVKQLRALAAKYHRCQIVVTCRTAIYRDQLAPDITAKCHVAEFDDRHIRLFLRQWPGIPDATAVERLLAALRDAPKIMKLAQNPLLLTMIAYLYGGRSSDETVLPHSRAEFYHEATGVLLDRLKHAGNFYQRPVKQAALMRLALVIQNTAATSSDRRTLRYEDVLAEIRAISHNLGIQESEADKLLDEIVERSGLLLRIDGGIRYQFAHLSLQEYLAAVSFEQDRDALLAEYLAAPEDWREVVKLWCGAVSTDCAPLIEKVFDVDPILAFECLADAQNVNKATADRVTTHFYELLRTGKADQAVITAFGLVAADPRPRGRKVLEFLTAAVKNHARAAYLALAATKRPEAAEALIGEIDSSAAQSALVALGDLAVPALSAASKAGRQTAVNALGAIATPAAAVALVDLLVHDRPWIARGAAWYLASLFDDPEVEVALRGVEAPEPPETFAWVWDPFRQQTGPAVARIAGTVAALCHDSGKTGVPPGIDHIDPRLAIPLLSLGFRGTFQHSIQSWRIVGDRDLEAIREASYGEKLEPGGEVSPLDAAPRRVGSARETTESPFDKVDKVDKDFREHLNVQSEPVQRWLYSMLDLRLRISLVARLAARAADDPVALEPQDWSQVRRARDTYTYVGGSHRRTALTIFLLYLLAAIAGAAVLATTGWPWGPSWIGLTLPGAALLDLMLVMVMSVWNPTPPHDELFDLVAPYAIYRNVRILRDLPDWNDIFSAFMHTVLSSATTALLLLVGSYYVGWPASIAIMLLVVGAAAALYWYGRRRERAARNPLRGLLELDEGAARRRTSIIAS